MMNIMIHFYFGSVLSDVHILREREGFYFKQIRLLYKFKKFLGELVVENPDYSSTSFTIAVFSKQKPIKTNRKV